MPVGSRRNTRRYKARLRLQRRAGRLLLGIVVLLILGLTPPMTASLHTAIDSAFGGGLTAGGGILLATLMTSVVFRAELQPLGQNPDRARRRLQVLLLAAAGILIFSLLVLSHTVAIGIANGGWVTNSNTFCVLGNSSASSLGTVTVTNPGSRWYNISNLHIGNGGSGTMDISDGGTVSNTNGYIAPLGNA